MERPSPQGLQRDDIISALEDLDNEVCSIYAHIDSLAHAADDGSAAGQVLARGAWLAYERLQSAWEKLRSACTEELRS